MRTSVLSALLTGVLSVAAIGCSDPANDDGSWSESALKGTLEDGGTCRCAKETRGKKTKDASLDDGKAKSDAGRGKSGDAKTKTDAGRGKSEEHGKKDAGAEDEDAVEEDAADEEVEALKFTPDAGKPSKQPKPSVGADCVC